MTKRFAGLMMCVCALAMVGCGSSGGSNTVNDSGADVAADRGGSFGSDGSSGSGGDATSGSDSQSGDDGSLGADGTSAGEGGSSGDDGAGGDSAMNGDGGGITSCTPFGSVCSYGAQCCSGICDPTSSTCISSVTTCTPGAGPCTANTDCCSGACVSGQCGAALCLSIGESCPVQGNTCCTGNCSGGACQPIATNPSCTTAGNVCTSDAQCCSGLCGSNGRCALGSSYCIQSGDICYHANDCCGGICSAPNGQPVTSSNAGVCGQPTSGGVNCTAVDGTICPGGGCGSCCSRLCAPYGPTGVNICQPAQGCRVEGDLCRTNVDCCGAMGSGVLGDGSVVCSTSVNGGSVGVCMTPGPTANGGTCVPEGDVCHYNQSNYTCSISSARADCCGDQRPRFLACVLDPFGVPRCNAYTGVGDGGPGCIGAGNACSMATECCNGTPCVANASGQLVCSATSCQQSGQSCTTNSDCCAGLPCVAPPGSIHGTCTPVRPPPPPPSDAGSDATPGGDASTPTDSGSGNDSGFSPDGGYSCALYGQSCASLPCCAGTQCISGKCSTF
jgi:hypothetical protein